MLTLPRRFLLLCALLFWQGGFTFYAAVVVPVAGGVLAFDLHLRARITDQAARCLNWAGVAAVALLLWDLLASADPSQLRRAGRGACWAMMFLTLAALFGLHAWLEMLDPPGGTGPADRGAFYVAHTLYLCASGLQWLAALVFLALSVGAWRRADGERVAAKECGLLAGGEEKKG